MKKLLLICLLSFITIFSASAQLFQWAQKQENGFSPLVLPGLPRFLHNPSGNFLSNGNQFIAATGIFMQPLTLGNQTLVPVDSIDAFLAVRDFSGNILWLKHIVSQTITWPSVIIDQNQDIILSGIFQDSLFIDNLLIKSTTAGNRGLFTAKFSPTGKLIWIQSSYNINNSAQVAFSLGFNNSPSVTVDDNGNIYVAREFEGTFSVNNQSLTAAGTQSDIFLLKYDAAGNFQWLRNVGRASSSEANIAIKACKNGGVYLVNSFLGQSVSIARIDQTGLITWRTSIAQNITKMDFTLDAQNNAYLTAYYNSQKPFTIGNMVLPAIQNSPINILLAKIDNSGNWKWAKSIVTNIINPNNPFSPNSIFDAPKLIYDSKNNLALSGVFVSTSTGPFPWPGTQFTGSVPPLSPERQGTFVSKLDTAGNAIWTNVIGTPLNNLATYNHPTGLCADQAGNYYVSGKVAGDLEAGSIVISATNGLENTFLAKLISHANSIAGRVFVDSNNNSVFDSGENPFPEIILGDNPKVINGISASDGTYSLFVPAGITTINIANPPRHYVISPASHTASFSGLNQTQAGKDFALQPVPNSPDAGVTITTFPLVRLGREFTYRLTFKNHGTTVLSDTLKFTFNTANINFVGSSVTPSSQSTGKLVWYYQNLQPNETRNIDVTFLVSINSTLGTPLTANATIKPLGVDLVPTDNIFTITHPIQGPYDPNDKQVDKPVISPTMAANGEFLDYTIRFQNVGTDTAFTVIVTDEITNQLDLGQFEMLSASHPYKLSLNNNNQLEWRFDNILLPDSGKNEPESHGFVRFRIKTKPGLVLGDSIANKAAIYFDYNAPVITNYALTKVANPTGIRDSKADNSQAFKIYPNPARNYVMVAANFRKNTAASVSLINLLGQTLSKVTLPANDQIHYQMPLKDLPKGVYIIQLETEAGRQTQRLVIQ